jgi:hypothetical protein
VCHLWNLIAEGTREGDVYLRLLEKLEQARKSLGGQVFDVLGKLQFEGRPLRDLLIEAIRYGDQPEVRARLTEAVETALDGTTLSFIFGAADFGANPATLHGEDPGAGSRWNSSQPRPKRAR